MIDAAGNVCCDSCGQILELGMHPFCPHGFGGPVAFHDEIPGGLVVENYGPNPIRFDSHSERRRYMVTHGLHEKEKFSPLPGTDKDPQGIPNPKGFVDPQTLANGIALITRQQKVPEFDAVESGVMRGFFSGTMTERDAVKVGEGDARRSSRLGRRIKDGPNTSS